MFQLKINNLIVTKPATQLVVVGLFHSYSAKFQQNFSMGGGFPPPPQKIVSA
jgi:hypothetical protein